VNFDSAGVNHDSAGVNHDSAGVNFDSAGVELRAATAFAASRRRADLYAGHGEQFLRLARVADAVRFRMIYSTPSRVDEVSRSERRFGVGGAGETSAS
jgi:hypothetical protein